jgi:hypothetical protein
MRKQTFSSTPNAALARLIGAFIVALFCTFALGFTVWSVVSFGAFWGILVLIGVPYLVATPIFVKGTWDNWHDWRRHVLLAKHHGGIEGLLASELSTYHLEIGKPGYVIFDHFFHWLDQKKSILDTSNTLDAIIMLEEAGQIRREYPAGGGLIIHILPAFHARPVFALAPKRHD